MTFFQLFWSFLQVGAFSVGGGYAAMPLIQAQVVDTFHWLTMDEFTNLVTIAEMTPGPIAINAATFVGARIAGLPGAISATFGCILPSLIIVSLLARVYQRLKGGHGLENLLSCLRPVVVALIAAAGLSILHTAVLSGAALAPENLDWISLILFLVALGVLRKWKLNPVAVMCCCGAAGFLLKVLFFPL